MNADLLIFCWISRQLKFYAVHRFNRFGASFTNIKHVGWSSRWGGVSRRENLL